MIPALSFVGHHNSGKTRILTSVLPLLVERGLRVGTVKHAPHLDRIDSEGSDSSAHRNAGADRVLLHGETVSALFWSHGGEDMSEELERLFVDCDLVLVEGFKRGPFPKIEVFRRGREMPREPLAGEIDVLAVVSDEHVALPDGVVQLSPRRPDEIAQLIEQTLFPER